MKLTIDFETRSKVDLKKCGVYRYAQDESTDVLCLAVKVDDAPAIAWDREGGSELTVPDLRNLIASAELIEAHNANFERTMWPVATKRYGFPALPFERLRCSAAVARYYSLPGALGEACKAMGLELGKDQEGYRLMLKMCKPKSDGTWHYSPELLARLVAYCKQDTEAEYLLSSALGHLPPSEQAVYYMDQVINDRGIPVDVKGAQRLIDIVKARENKLIIELQALTGGKIKSTRQNAKTIEWLESNGVEMENLRKETVDFTLDGLELPETARRLLEIRQSLSKSSVAKLDAIVRSACTDERVRGTLMYHGSHTGRWAGRLVQVQNLPRNSFDEKQVDELLRMDADAIEMIYDCPVFAASKCIRGMIRAEKGELLIAADFSAIEARILAWLAGEEDILAAYVKGVDIYKLNAMNIYSVPYDKVSKDQRQIGKVAELALGYQGFTGAFQAMAKGYGVKMSDEQAGEIAMRWREARPKTVQYWAGVETAAIKAVKTKQQTSYGRVKFGVRGRFLHCRLPSGRLLAFPYPSVDKVTTKYGKEKMVVKYWGEDDKGHWSHLATYGGKLTENIVQAISRDLLVYSMQGLEAQGIKVVMHVHDEIVALVPEDKVNVKAFEEIVKSIPDWAAGLPMNAEAWAGIRYRK